MTRRTLLTLAAASTIVAPARAATSPRTIALDWALAATAIGIGAAPAGVAETRLYREWVGAPALPAETIEIGLRTGPSLETIARLRPDLIFTNGLDAAIRPRLEAIAPTYDNAIFTAERRPLERAVATARDLGRRLGREKAAQTLIAEAEARFAAARSRLSGRGASPVVPLAFDDARHLRIYGRGSLIDDVMRRLGLSNGWIGDTNIWGFALTPIETLAPIRDATLLVLAPVPPEARGARKPGTLWSALAAANRNRIVGLPPVWSFGDLTAALRCADLLADALSAGAPA